jgi:4-amino-4-deoxy-L-arabinose transferase-like glycosyltransferase
MNSLSDTGYMTRTWFLLFICFVVRLLYAHSFLLVPDETNYWQWARHLAWGYHDQAPLIAWSIRLSVELFGHTELAVRMPSIISMSVASIYLVLIARHWFSARIAWQTALVSQTMLLFNVGGLLATADGLQGAAWAGAAFHCARAYEKNRWRQWLAAGLWFGIGLLSKYTMVVFPLGVYGFGLLSSQHRRLLAQMRPYIAFAAGCLLFTPVIGWNIANGWNSARHVASIGGADQSLGLHLRYFGDFIGSQAALVSPLVFILICITWLRIARRNYPAGEWIYFFLFCISFPMVAGFALLSLHTRVYGNWPGAGYLGAVILAAAFFGNRGLRIWKWSVLSSAFLTFIVLLQVLWPILPIPARHDRTAYEIRGWDFLGQRVGRIIEEMPAPRETFPFGFNYQVASELAFYIPGQPRTVAINRWSRPNVYDYWWTDGDLVGQDGIGVTDRATSMARLLEVFERVEGPEAIEIHRTRPWSDQTAPATLVKTWYIYRCYYFKGGLRWVPKRSDDVRAGGKQESR